jgi:hypothetical protein
MTHLYIAKKLLDKQLYSIKNKAQYYLGNLVPDAVEFRKKYDKKISHLCNDESKWGFIVNYEKWAENVMEFYKMNIRTNDHDFLTGYCIHILADINYSNEIWTPFRLKNENENFENVSRKSHDESNNVDLELYQRCIFKDEIWEILNKSKCINFMDIVKREEMEKMKNNVLNIQYNNKPLVNSRNNTILTYNGLLNYIENTIKYINEKMIWKM